MNSTDIANAALAQVCEHQVTSLDDKTASARLAKVHFAATVREVLSAFPWRCARKRTVLARLAEKPAFGWAYQYQLPSDFLRVVALNEYAIGTAHTPLFEVEGDLLLTNESPAHLSYVRDVTADGTGVGIGHLDALCCKVIYLTLAAKMAWSFEQAQSLRDSLLMQAKDAENLAKARSTRDALEHVTPYAPGDPLGLARQGGLLYADR
jgi:hypothetical protein